MSGQSGGKRMRLSQLNEHLTCKLCKGYFVDATTIIECLHSFCRSCIVKYLETNKYCPICEVQVHKSKPLLNIRPDHTLQDIVYKLVPGCYQNEMRRRREYYQKNTDAVSSCPTPESRGEPVESCFYSPDESLSLSLEYHNSTDNKTEEEEEESEGEKLSSVKPLPKRYLRCPAAVTIFHLQKLIRAKYGLTDAHRVDVLYMDEQLDHSLSLMDVMYIHHWRRKVPLHLSYRIFESSVKRLKLSEDNAEVKDALSSAGISQDESSESQSSKWKEVQLKISETGVMSVTDISSPESKKSTKAEEANESEDKESKSCAGAASVTIKSDVVLSERESPTKASKKSKEPGKTSPRESKPVTPRKLIDSKQTDPSKKSNATAESPKDAVNSVSKNNADKTSVSQKAAQSANKVQSAQKDAKNDNAQHPNNNNVIRDNKTTTDTGKSNANNSGNKGDVKNSNAGSKIDALSAKLQYQPKIGQVNNTYSKKSQKEKKSATPVVKKAEVVTKNPPATPAPQKTEPAKVAEEPPGAKTRSNNAALTVKTTTAAPPTTTQDAIVTTTSSSAATTQATPSVSSNNSQQAKKDVGKSKESSSHQSLVNTLVESLQTKSSDPKKPNITITEKKHTSPSSEKSPPAKSKSFPPLSESLASLGLNVSTTMLASSLGQKSPTFPYSSLQQYVNSTLLKSPKSAGDKHRQATTMAASASGAAIHSPMPPFSIQTPSMSIYSISSPKNSSSGQSSGTETSSSSSSFPPCPDAIPISMMRPMIRKQEVIAKGTNINEICAKIGISSNSGSKINDICAKIGENSKEKNKVASRLEVPDLLKITKKNEPPSKHIPSIPNVPIYTPNSLVADATKMSASLSAQKNAGIKRKQSHSMGYKTLRDPPKPWNPTLSTNNYVAAKNQAQAASTSDGNVKSIASKPAKIYTMKNTLRYLGNPASGVKPMYGVSNEAKDKDPSSSSGTSGSMSMLKIDPKTLKPISSADNSPMISPPPPYSPNSRSYQSNPYQRDCRNSSSPISPRNSPVNMLSTNPFIPSVTPNPNIIYSHFPHFPHPDPGTFSNPLIRSPIGMSAYHGGLPPAIGKLFHRNYLPQTTTTYSPVTTPPTVQRIPPSTHTTSPKSPKSLPGTSSTSASSSSSSSTFNLAKTETQTSMQTSSVDNVALQLAKNAAQQEANKAFNLTKSSAPSSTVAEISKSTPPSVSTTVAKISTQLTVTATPSSQSKSSPAPAPSPKQKAESPAKTTEPKSKPDVSEGEKKVESKEEAKAKSEEMDGSMVLKDAISSLEKFVPKVNGEVTSPPKVKEKKVEKVEIDKEKTSPEKPKESESPKKEEKKATEAQDPKPEKEVKIEAKKNQEPETKKSDESAVQDSAKIEMEKAKAET